MFYSYFPLDKLVASAEKSHVTRNAVATVTIPMFVGKVRDHHPSSFPAPHALDNRLQNNAKKVYTAALESLERVQVSTKGWATFSCPPGGLQVWIPGL